MLLSEAHLASLTRPNSLGDGHREQPVFLLAPHRSCTSLVCAMLGQHPALIDVPETNLATAETLGGWLARHARGRAFNAEGLVRAIAELRFGDQTGRSVRAAWWWIEHNVDLATDRMWTLLDSWVDPLGLVEKSPAVAYDRDHLERLLTRWPNARYVHLLRHPVSYSKSMLKMPAARRWMELRGAVDDSGWEPSLDPAALWHEAHTNILDALGDVPDDRQVRIRAEDLLSEPDRTLTEISEHFGLPVDRTISAAMQLPERSPFAHLGPPGARFGNDPSFLREPRLQPERQSSPPSLVGPLPWRRDGRELAGEVADFAHSLGYV